MFPRTISCTGDTGRKAILPYRVAGAVPTSGDPPPQDAVLSFRPGSWLPGEGGWGRAGDPAGLCTRCPRAQSAWVSVTMASRATTFLGAPEGKLVRRVLLSTCLRGEHSGPER